MNLAPHIGHSFSAFRTDAYARFKRAQGFNVLYPQAFHATGEPILGVVERLKKGDQVQLETMKLCGATDADIERFKQNPRAVVEFWVRRWIEDLRLGGFSIDWRRTFITTTITPTYSRFIEWQYNTLQKKGYVTQGTHPVIWCPKCLSPTGDHDRLEGEGESPIDYVLLKFELEMNGEKIILPAATLRPETIYGVVNMWLHPDIEYVKARVKSGSKSEIWLISADAAKKLADQLKKVEIIGNVRGADLAGKRCRDLVTNKMIPILPAHFVDPCNATGVVMSVPSHAPYDWVALKELLEKPEELERYGVTKEELDPISLIAVPEFGEHPAIELANKMNITSTKQQKELDAATSILYKKEFHLGTLKQNCGEYSGKKVSEVKDHLIRDLTAAGIADIVWETTARVVCRCTTPNHVKILENQWFLKFSDEKWKARARACVKKMNILPEEARHQFEETISWLKDKACARKTGLGTPLPWDKNWIVETLSDSTIYMAYYTIARLIKKKKIPAAKLTDDVFDYIFFGKGEPKAIALIAKRAGLAPALIKEMRAEFLYWYPVDFRNSGKDLVANHLTFFIFHHTAIWDSMPKLWPLGIGVNGFVNVEGEKMSKSKGNVIPLRDLIRQHGTDLVRANIISSAEGLDDADWRTENIRSLRARLQMLLELAAKLKTSRTAKVRNATAKDKTKSKKAGQAEKWLRSRIQRHIAAATTAYEAAKFRTAINAALYDSTADLKWYLARVGDIKAANALVLKDVLMVIARLIAPAAPHIAEEIWQRLGNRPFIAVAPWPKAEKHLTDKKAEANENLIKATLEDGNAVLKIVKKKPSLINIYAARPAELKILKDAVEVFAAHFGVPVEIILAAKSSSPRAARAKAGKPGIEIL